MSLRKINFPEAPIGLFNKNITLNDEIRLIVCACNDLLAGPPHTIHL